MAENQGQSAVTDIVDKETRSRMMSGIGGKDTKPELVIRRALHARGFRFRLHDKRLPGKPDLTLPKYNAVIFVHGCFWHRHKGCRYATTPSTRPEFWAEKFSTNVERDARNEADLKALGWRVAVIWECALRPNVAEANIDDVETWLWSTSMSVEI